MQQLIDSKSPQTLLSELDLQSMPGSQVGVQNCKWRRVNLKNSLTPGSTGPFEFQLASNSKCYLNLKRSWLVWKFYIGDAKGARIPILDSKGNPNGVYAPVQGIASAIAKQYILHINSQIVEAGSVNTAYRSFMENELMLSDAAKESSLAISGYRLESDYDLESSKGFKARAKLTEGGKSCEVACRLPLDLASQNKLLLNYLDVRLTVYTNPAKWLTEQFSATVPTNYTFVIEDAYVLANEYDLADGYMASVEKHLLSNRIQYPLNSVQMRSLFIDAGRLDSPHFVAFSTHLPKRITLGLVSAEAFNGHQQKSPFRFNHHDLSNINIDLAGVSHPGRPWKLDFENGLYSDAFISTLDALGLSRSGESNGISMEKFVKGWAMYSVELSPTIHDPDMFDLIRQGNVTIRLEFKKAVPAGGLVAIILGEFDSILSIDANRNPHIDSIL